VIQLLSAPIEVVRNPIGQVVGVNAALHSTDDQRADTKIRFSIYTEQTEYN